MKAMRDMINVTQTRIVNMGNGYMLGPVTMIAGNSANTHNRARMSAADALQQMREGVLARWKTHRSGKRPESSSVQ